MPDPSQKKAKFAQLSQAANAYIEEEKKVSADDVPLVHITKQFIENVIEKVEPQFVTGHRLHMLFGKSLQKDDELFVWDANRIDGTRFTAGSGPQHAHYMNIFLEDIVFNKHRLIKQIVAFGNCLHYDRKAMSGDFFDYVIKEGSVTFGAYLVVIRRISGVPDFNKLSDQVYPSGIIESELTVTYIPGNETRVVNVTLFSIVDNDSLYLDGGQRELDEQKEDEGFRFLQSCEKRKEVLWQLIRRSTENDFFVHCKSGYGRTGHFIATAEMVNHFQEIFASKNVGNVVNNILEMVSRLRMNRPWLLLTREQLFDAIRNAEILYQYGLKKRHLQSTGILNTPSVVRRLIEIEAQQAAKASKVKIQVEEASADRHASEPTSNQAVTLHYPDSSVPGQLEKAAQVSANASESDLNQPVVTFTSSGLALFDSANSLQPPLPTVITPSVSTTTPQVSLPTQRGA